MNKRNFRRKEYSGKNKDKWTKDERVERMTNDEMVKK